MVLFKNVPITDGKFPLFTALASLGSRSRNKRGFSFVYLRKPLKKLMQLWLAGAAGWQVSSDVGCRYQAICASSTGCKGPFLPPASAFGIGWIPVLLISGSVTRPARPGLRRGGCRKPIKIKPSGNFGFFSLIQGREARRPSQGATRGPPDPSRRCPFPQSGSLRGSLKRRRVCPVSVSVKVENIP